MWWRTYIMCSTPQGWVPAHLLSIISIFLTDLLNFTFKILSNCFTLPWLCIWHFHHLKTIHSLNIFFWNLLCGQKGARSQEYSVKKIFTAAAHTGLSILPSWHSLLASCDFCVFSLGCVPWPFQACHYFETLVESFNTPVRVLNKMLFIGLFIYLIPLWIRYDTGIMLYLFHF